MNLNVIGLAPLALSWLGCFVLCRRLAGRGCLEDDWRLGWMLACLAWGALLTWIVELANVARLVTAPALMAGWTAAAAIVWGAAIRLRPALSHQAPGAAAPASDPPASPAQHVADAGAGRAGGFWSRAADDWRRRWPSDARWMLAAAAALMAGLGILAVATPTTNWDSLTYHLPRVMHWIQERSIGPYPTNNTCQIEYGPWPALVILTLHLFSGGDRLDNLVQWFAMVTCVIACSYLAERLAGPAPGGDGESERGAATRRRLAAWTALLTATLPIGVVESISTQTDYVVTGWAAVLMAFVPGLWRDPGDLRPVTAAGLALGLGILSKVTMFLYAGVPAAIFGLAWLLRAPGRAVRVRGASLFVLALLLITAPHALRNQAVFGSSLGSVQVSATQRNRTVSLGGTASNLIRNLALQTNTGIRPLTDRLNGFLFRLHGFTGRDLQDPDLTFHSGRFGVPDRFLIFDSYAGNFYHLLLVPIGAALLLRGGRRVPVLLYLGGVSAGFLVFCALLRWQQWHGRIHLGWLVLLTPVAGALAAAGRGRIVLGLGAAWLWGFAVYCALHNASRPVLDARFMGLPREQQYLETMAPAYYPALKDVAADIAGWGCDRVGIKFDYDDPEYALWVILRNRGFQGRIDHFYVENESAHVRSTAPAPCAIVTTFPNLPPEVARLAVATEKHGPFTVIRLAAGRSEGGPAPP